MSLKNYSLKELKDEVERRENAAHSRQWSRQKKHYEEKCKHCCWYHPTLLNCSKMNVGIHRCGYAWDFASCKHFKKYEGT